jgi:hypothetical protein
VSWRYDASIIVLLPTRYLYPACVLVSEEADLGVVELAPKAIMNLSNSSTVDFSIAEWLVSWYTERVSLQNLIRASQCSESMLAPSVVF